MEITYRTKRAARIEGEAFMQHVKAAGITKNYRLMIRRNEPSKVFDSTPKPTWSLEIPDCYLLSAQDFFGVEG